MDKLAAALALTHTGFCGFIFAWFFGAALVIVAVALLIYTIRKTRR